jgi:type VI secretion system protein ImpH
MASENGAAAGDLGGASGDPSSGDASTATVAPPAVAAGPAAAAGSSGASSREPLSPARAAAVEQIISMLSRAPHEFDFNQVMRRLEGLYRDRPDRPRFGAALRPSDEPIRLGQDPSMAFAPSALAGLTPGRQGGPPRLGVHFFGLLGPNGPLPLHITEYARERLRNSEDATMSRFFDVFHHRMLMLFYRAWSSGEPTVEHDYPSSNRFVTYVGALIGLGLPSLQGQDEFPDPARLFYAGRLAAQARNADGLCAVIGDFFRLPARIESFVGDWMALPIEYQWRLGDGPQRGLLGVSTTAGGHIWSRQQKFRVVLGPLNRAQFQRMLPGGGSIRKLAALVRHYVGEELRWDLRLMLDERTEEPCHLGRSRLGWTSWLGRAGRGPREDLILDPQAENYPMAA